MQRCIVFYVYTYCIYIYIHIVHMHVYTIQKQDMISWQMKMNIIFSPCGFPPKKLVPESGFSPKSTS